MVRLWSGLVKGFCAPVSPVLRAPSECLWVLPTGAGRCPRSALLQANSGSTRAQMRRAMTDGASRPSTTTMRPGSRRAIFR